MQLTDIKTLAETVFKYSPLLANAIGSPLSGIVTSLVSSLFNVTPENLNAVIASNPDSEATLKKFEMQHQEELAKIASTDFSIEVDDRKNARDREIKETQLLGRRDWVMDTIAIVVVLGFFSMSMVVALTKMDLSDHDVLFMLIGQLSAGFLGILSFFFGSIRKP